VKGDSRKRCSPNHVFHVMSKTTDSSRIFAWLTLRRGAHAGRRNGVTAGVCVVFLAEAQDGRELQQSHCLNHSRMCEHWLYKGKKLRRLYGKLLLPFLWYWSTYLFITAAITNPRRILVAEIWANTKRGGEYLPVADRRRKGLGNDWWQCLMAKNFRIFHFYRLTAAFSHYKL